MADRWTNTYSIIQDLSEVQGHVPVDIDRPAIFREKPPTPVFKEDADDIFDNECSPEYDYGQKPDYGMIKEMINMARDNKSENEDLEHYQLEVSKLNPQSEEFIPQSEKDKKPKKNRTDRNVALTSLLKMNAEKNIKLLRPEDFMVTQTEPENKKEIIEAKKETNRSVHNKMPVFLEAKNMFKKKAVKKDRQDVDPQVVETPKPKIEDSYKPTEYAEQYYKMLEERRKLRDMATEDVWSRAERQMKEIEAKRQAEAKAQVEAKVEAEMGAEVATEAEAEAEVRTSPPLPEVMQCASPL